MSVTNVKSRWVAGNLEFLDRAGDIIATWNGSDRTLDMAQTGILNIGGTPVSATAEQLSNLLQDPGQVAVGRAVFGAQGDGDVTVRGVVYALSGAPTITDGEWDDGGSAATSATNLAAAINGDERNDGGPHHSAIASGDAVFIFGLSAGVEYNGDITIENAQPTETENLEGGVNPGILKTVVIAHTVTTQEAAADDIHIPIPFEPTSVVAEARDSDGVFQDWSSKVTIEDNPDRIRIENDGATNPSAGDVVTLVVQG